MNASATGILARNASKRGRYDVPLPPTPAVYCTEPAHVTQQAYRKRLMGGLCADAWTPVARASSDARGRDVWTPCSRLYAAVRMAAGAGFAELRRDTDGTGAVLLARLVGGGTL